MRRPDLADDRRFRTAEDRATHLQELHSIVQSWIRTFPNRAAEPAVAVLGQLAARAGGARLPGRAQLGVLRELGYADAEIAALEAAGALVAAPRSPGAKDA